MRGKFQFFHIYFSRKLSKLLTQIFLIWRCEEGKEGEERRGRRRKGRIERGKRRMALKGRREVEG